MNPDLLSARDWIEITLTLVFLAVTVALAMSHSGWWLCLTGIVVLLLLAKYVTASTS